jgi:hypothetical protein
VPLVFKGENEMGHNNNGTIWGMLCGIGGGLTKYFLQIHDQPFVIKLCEAGITALVCGALGAAGKHLYDFAKKKFLKLK